MRAYEATATIDAAPEAVWQVLLDGRSYTSWNSGVVALEGEIEHTPDEFTRNALMLVSDGTTPKTERVTRVLNGRECSLFRRAAP